MSIRLLLQFLFEGFPQSKLLKTQYGEGNTYHGIFSVPVPLVLNPEPCKQFATAVVQFMEHGDGNWFSESAWTGEEVRPRILGDLVNIGRFINVFETIFDKVWVCRGREEDSSHSAEALEIKRNHEGKVGETGCIADKVQDALVKVSQDCRFKEHDQWQSRRGRLATFLKEREGCRAPPPHVDQVLLRDVSQIWRIR